MIRIKKFKDYDEFEKYYDDRECPNDVITMIESDTRINVDLNTVCKFKKTAIKRFFKAVKDYPDLMEWDGWINIDNNEDENIKDEVYNYMTKTNDFTGNYAIGVEYLQDNSWYIFMNVAKEYKILTGLQYDSDYSLAKEIEYSRQTEEMQEKIINRFEIELKGEWKYTGYNETVKNIKIYNLSRDRTSGTIYISYSYTIYEDYHKSDKDYNMYLTLKNGKIDYIYGTNKMKGFAEYEFNDVLTAYIYSIIPDFKYLSDQKSE
jgi:hypothetical protein